MEQRRTYSQEFKQEGIWLTRQAGEGTTQGVTPGILWSNITRSLLQPGHEKGGRPTIGITKGGTHKSKFF